MRVSVRLSKQTKRVVAKISVNKVGRAITTHLLGNVCALNNYTVYRRALSQTAYNTLFILTNTL